MDKEQIKKIILGVFVLIALLYVYFTFFLGPLQKTRDAMVQTTNDLQGKIDSSKTEIAKTAKLEQNARAATERYQALRALNPEGAPIAWFPPWMKNFFAEQRMDHAAVRLEGTAPCKQKELASWSNYNWLVDLPQADFLTLGRAIAQLENSEPLLAINKLTIHASTDSPALQQASLSVSTIIDKR